MGVVVEDQPGSGQSQIIWNPFSVAGFMSAKSLGKAIYIGSKMCPKTPAGANN